MSGDYLCAASLIKPNLEHVHWTIKYRLFLSVLSVCSAYTGHKLTWWNLKIQTWIIKQVISSEFYYTPFQRGSFVTFIDKSGVFSPLHIKCDQLATVSWNSSKKKVSLCGVVMSLGRSRDSQYSVVFPLAFTQPVYKAFNFKKTVNMHKIGEEQHFTML